MIRTRPDFDDSTPIAGNGQYVLALDQEELELIAAFVGMVKLGQRPYEEAAFRILDAIEELTDDPDFSLDALNEIQPTVEILDGSTCNTVAEYDYSHVFQFCV